MLRRLFPAHFRHWLGPLIVAAIAAGLLGALIVISGVVDLSAAKPHPVGWARFLHYTFRRSTAHNAFDGAPPADLDTPLRIAAGAPYYGQVCARCHGAPGLGQNPVVLSMHPRPQYLVSDLNQPHANFSPQELFRIVKAGVKYSAMPSWPADGRDDEVWNLVAFLRALPRISPEQFQAMTVVTPKPDASNGRATVLPSPATRYHLRNDDEPPVASFAYKTPAFGFADGGTAIDPVARCTLCHGADGAGRGAFPNLTLQDRDYLARTLTAFAAGQRRSGYMQMVATSLSPAQIASLADYYAGLPRKATERTGTPFPAAGEQLVLKGDPKRKLAACASCHGINRPAGHVYPRLEGQSRWYVANQMHVFRAGGRGEIEGANPMTAIARRMTGAEIEAVAAYYAAQPPLSVQPQPAVPGTP